MLVVPTYEELKQRVCELESRTLQTEQVEDAAVWDGLLRKPPVDNLPAGFAYFNEEFVLLDCNKAYKEFLRIHTPFTAEQASGMCHFDYKPDSSPYLEDWFRYVRDSGRAHTRYDLRLGITREGQHHISYWDAHLAPVVDSAGRQMGVLMCCIDATERNLLKEAMNTSGEGWPAELLSPEELKTALRVVLSLVEEDRRRLQQEFLSNVEQMILPWVERLKQSHLHIDQKACLDMIEANLRRLGSPFSSKVSSMFRNLTPTEIQVVQLVRGGKTSKEIAALLRVSKECIDFHRNNIRKKIGLNKRKTSLKMYLLGL